MNRKHTANFIFIGFVVIGCIGLGIWLWLTADEAPALILSVLLGISVTALLYGVIGGVSDAGFSFGPLKMGGSAAVLLGSIWMFNYYLEAQLQFNRSGENFDLDRHVEPHHSSWFAINRTSGEPIEIEFTSHADSENAHTTRVSPPLEPAIQFDVVSSPMESVYRVRGRTLTEDDDVLGEINLSSLKNRWLSEQVRAPTDVARDYRIRHTYGPQRLHLSRAGELASDTPRDWGSNEKCRGNRMPIRLRAMRFKEGFADYDVYVCGVDSFEVPIHESSLSKGQGELLSLDVEGRERYFLISVLAANHLVEPPWSSFVVLELEVSDSR